MRKNTQRVIEYCIKQGLISAEQFNSLKDQDIKFAPKDRDKNLLTIVARELGCDKEKAKAIIKQALKDSGAEDVVSTAIKLAPVSKAESKQETFLNKKEEDYPKTSPIVASVSSETISEGKRFGKYILEKKLGSGGMGAVFKAYHPKLESYFALKIVFSEKLGEEGIQRFEREARVSSKLRHPNIVHVHDVGVQGRKHYIVMDYIEGRTLTDMIEKRRFWPRKAFEIMLQITGALQYSHDQGIIHRDIKPSNIMIVEKDGKDIPYLMDFGIASVVKEEGLTREGQIMGTPQYMSPEQARGSKKVDARSDIYSLGVVLYEMLTGKPAVESNQVMVVLYNVLHRDPPLLSTIVQGIAKDVEAITMKCLEKDPSRRYQKADELADDIERYLRGEAVLARSPSYLYRLWRKAMRNLKFTAVIAMAIVLLIGLTVLWILSLQEQARELEKTKEAQVKELEKTREEALKVIRVKINETWNEAINQEKLEKFDKALDLCKTLIDWDPTDNRFSKKLVEITQKKDAFQKDKEDKQKEARKYYDRAMEVFWNPRLDEDELNRCKELFEKAITEYPAFADAHFQAGRAAHRLLKTEEALKHYEAALKCDPNLSPPKYYMTILEISSVMHKIITNLTLYEIKKKFEDIWCYSVDKIGPEETTDPYLLLGKAFILLSSIGGKKSQNDSIWKECLACCNKVIKNHPNFSDAYLMRAQLYSYWIEICLYEYRVHTFLDPVDLDQALKDCSHALYLDPYRMEGYALRGAIYKSIGGYDIAEKDYSKAILLKRGAQANFYRNRALCYVAMGKGNLAMKDLDKNIELMKNVQDENTQAEAFLWKALVKSMLKGKKEAEEALTNYISSRSRNTDKALFDGFIKTFIYMFVDDEINRAEETFRGFMKTNDSLFKMGQMFANILNSKTHNHQPGDFIKLLSGFSNLICLDPRLKQRINAIPDILSFIKNIPYLRDTGKLGYEFSVMARACLEYLNKVDKKGEENHKKINDILAREYPPLSLDLFIYTLDYVSENGTVQTMMKLKKLPSASLYYRRAIEHYFISKTSIKKTDDNSIQEKELENAKNDLEDALEFEPDFMEVHYSLAAVYSLLSAFNSDKKAAYKEAALDHLRQALENGWNHLEDYTLKDDDFKPLGLGNEISLETLRSWGKEWEENRKQMSRFEKKVNNLISKGKITCALRLLYNCEYSSLFNELTESAENKLMEYLKKLKEDERSDMEEKLELLFGEKGKMMWEEVKK